MPDIVQIPLKGGQAFPVDMDFINGPDFPVEMFRAVFLKGLQAVVNGTGMSKLTVKDLDGEELEEVQGKIRAQAEANFQALCEGKMGRSRAGGPKLPAAVKTRAMQKATALAKDAAKRAGYKWGAYSAAEKKEMAVLILENDPELIEEAKAELAAQEKKGQEKGIALPEKFKKAEAKAKPRGKPTAAIEAAKRKRQEGARARQ